MSEEHFTHASLPSKGSERGRIDGLAAQDGSELSALGALIHFAQKAKFVGGGEAAAGGRLADVGVSQQANVQVRHEWITFSP